MPAVLPFVVLARHLPAWVRWGVGTVLLYAVAAEAGLLLRDPSLGLALFWPASGVSFALLALGGRARAKPVLGGVALVVLVANLVHGSGVVMSLGFVLVNTSEPVLAVVVFAYLLRRAPGEGPLRLVGAGVAGAACGTAVGGALGATLLSATANAPWLSVWSSWTVADAAGIALAAPAVVALREHGPSGRRWELAGHTLMVALACAIAFGLADGANLAFLVLPPLAWGAIRLGPRWAAVTVLAVAVAITWLSQHGYGTFVNVEDPHDRMIRIQVFLTVVVTTTLAFAVLSRDLADKSRELTQANERLQVANSELERSNQDLVYFASAVAHDLKSPLTAIAGYAEMLADDMAESGPPESHRVARRILERSMGMADLVDDVLACARAGSSLRQVASVDMEEVTVGAVDALVTAMAESGARVYVERLPAVHGDPVQLGRLMQNLISNAVKFARPGVPPRVVVTGEQDGEGVLIAVTDNGIGVPEEERAQIFTMFARGAGGSDVSGSGIGLAECARIVGRHGGRLWVEDVEDGGARFVVRLPAPALPAPGATTPRLTVEARP